MRGGQTLNMRTWGERCSYTFRMLATRRPKAAPQSSEGTKRPLGKDTPYVQQANRKYSRKNTDRVTGLKVPDGKNRRQVSVNNTHHLKLSNRKPGALVFLGQFHGLMMSPYNKDINTNNPTVGAWSNKTTDKIKKHIHENQTMSLSSREFKGKFQNDEI